jgi:hypothetical protein
MRTVVAGGAILALLGMSSAASAELLYSFQVAGWTAGAFTRQNSRQFNHCGATASYTNSIMVTFAVSRTYQWSMGFLHRGWRLTPGQAYNIAFTVDQDPPIGGRAVAIGTSQVEVILADSSHLFQRFRQGQQLRVAAAGQILTFKLTGTSQLLPALLRCVQTNLQPSGSSTVASNPFVAPAPASSASQGRPPAYRAEAVALAANILGSAGVVGFRIVDDDKSGFIDAAWRADKMFGMVRIEPKEPPALISAGMIAVDAASCKSRFASGSMPATDKNELPRMFTKCGEGEQGWTVYYFIMPRKAGGHYLIGTGASGSDEPARQVESDLRQATMTVTGR